MDEILAENRFEKTAGHRYVYHGEDPFFKEKTGTFSILEDMNCCAPTLDVLYVFSIGPSRKVMDPSQFLEFLNHCEAL